MRVSSWPEAYFFVLGAIVFLQLPVPMRHLRNLFLFTTALGEGGIRGRIEYPRWVLFSVSSFEFVTFAGLFAAVYVFTESVMVLGGMVTCLLMTAQQWVLARRATRKTAAAPQGEDAAGA